MGEFLVNTQVRANNQERVVEAVRRVIPPLYKTAGLGVFSPVSEPATLIGPVMNGWVGVYDALMEAQDTELIKRATVELSEAMNTLSVTFLVHDGDQLAYWVAENGRLVDQYDPWTDEFDPESMTAPEWVAKIPGASAEKWQAAFADSEGFAMDQLQAIAEAIGTEGVMGSYSYRSEISDENYVSPY